MLSSHADYVVAWICALPLEMAAARFMLDEIHAPLPQPTSDHNTYTLGSIGKHKVVIACLPSGVYGTTSAAIVLAHMLPTFPSLRFGLMVGLGGGVPHKEDVRLGDVVVSTPTINSSGVIQYDYGKTLHDGCFQRTGSLNKSPHFLLTAISQMRSDAIIGERPITGILSTVFQRSNQIRDQFSRPDNDWLFKPEYDHQGNNADCSACDQTKLVRRTPRTRKEEPYIHYGLIASGNQVLKHAKKRDLIAQEMDILCFEMEAAGLMDQLPCLVIRGICDYCDSHKNKQWQPYAALVAAAYARALLILVPVHESHKRGYWMVPFQRNCGFMGREEEITKVEDLISQINGPSRIAIYGLGGIGKTQISLEIAYRMRERDPGCSIFWVPCTNYESVEQAYMDIAQVVGMQVPRPEETKENVKAYLSQESTGKWLLIFDNADDMDMWITGSVAAPAFKRFLPQSQQGRILFNTRTRMLAVKLASSQVVSVPELDQQTGLKIIEKSLIDYSRDNQINDAVVLLEQLAFVPLAITQAISYINENGISIATYAMLLKQQETQVIELLSEDFEDAGRYDAIQNPIALTWWISFQQIQTLNPLAANFLSFMACINSRDIPQSLLPLPVPVSENERIKAIGLLNAYSFISRQSDANFLTLHRLVRLAIRSRLRSNQQFSSQVWKVADYLSKIFPDNTHCNRALWRQYLPHALLVIGEKDFQERKEDYIILIQRIGRCLYSDGRYIEATGLFESVLKMQRKKHGEAHPMTVSSMADLAWTYNEQGRWKEAEELGVQVVEIYRQLLGPENSDTLTSINNLASVFMNLENWKKAEELGVQALKTRTKVLGQLHPDTITSMHDLANTYRRAGRWEEAEELGYQAMQIRKQVLELEHPDTLASMNNLASVYRSQGRWKEAAELIVQVLDIRKRVLGPEHPHTLISMGVLAYTWEAQGNVQDAIALLEKCIELRCKRLGPSHPHTTYSYQTLNSWKDREMQCLLPLHEMKLIAEGGYQISDETGQK